MLNASVELFLSEYFLIKAVLGKYLKSDKELFAVLSKIFLISKKDEDNLYSLAENDTAKKIATEKDFMQHQRLQKYSKLVGSERAGNAEWEEIARIKGNAIIIAQGQNLIPDADASRNVVYTCLSSAAHSGTILAMQIVGILQCEGIFIEKNRKAGLKNLSKAADWNDGVSILALLHYREENRGYDMARFHRVIKDTPFSKLYETASERYGAEGDFDVGEVKLVFKAFGAGVLKRESYDPQYARILNSKALYVKDKEKALFSQNKELLSIIGDLPLKLSYENVTAVDADAIRKVAVKREAEIASVVRALQNSDLRGLSSYRPLCLCADSKFLLNTYARAIAKGSKAAHMEIIDVGELVEYDFEPSPNNIFVRSIDEDKDNRFLLFFCGNVSERKTDAIKSILQTAKRAKFHLNNPNVTLNLSAVLPLCFCDNQNAELLKPYCDVIKLASITPDELSFAVNDILASKAKLYGTGTISLAGEACEIFGGYDIDTVESLVDSAVRTRREKGASIVLTREILQEYAACDDRPKIGFGGDTNGRNR